MKATPNGVGHAHDAFLPSGELHSPLARRMSLVSRDSLETVIRRAVVRALSPYETRVSGRMLFGLRAALERELLAGIRTQGKRVRGISKRDFLAELERSRGRIRQAQAVIECVEQSSGLSVGQTNLVENLKRRIAKLNSSLESAEELIQRLRKMKAGEEGLASLYGTVQGLALDDEQAEAKRGMLADIFESNIALQNQLRKTG